MAGALGVPEDRELSEYTGWTREHWLAQADHLLDSLKPFASPSSARFELPGRPSVSGFDSDALEGFARTFLLAAWRIAADRGRGPVAEDLIARYSSGLAAGADAAHSEAWPRIPQGRPGQPMVEAASIALGLHYTREWLWDRLDPRAQGLVADWLGEFIGNPTWPNNWMLFQTVTEEFLSSIGARYEESEILRGLDATEEWYVGDGWYTDGAGRNFDYYTAGPCTCIRWCGPRWPRAVRGTTGRWPLARSTGTGCGCSSSATLISSAPTARRYTRAGR
jgi:hypothetical protein